MTQFINHAIMKELTPTGMEEGRIIRKHELERRRASQQRDAWHFLTTGLSRGIPPYGKEWNRDYNPMPYPEAAVDPYVYMGTGIGCLYRLEGSNEHLWQLAGWNIVRTHAEVRARKKY